LPVAALDERHPVSSRIGNIEMNEIVFLIEEAPEGGCIARALGESIFTEADSFPRLHDAVRDAVHCHFDAREAPKLFRLHFVRGEVIPA
jgi:hypothetical protein